jgi:hypothetical protein
MGEQNVYYAVVDGTKVVLRGYTPYRRHKQNMSVDQVLKVCRTPTEALMWASKYNDGKSDE